MSAPWHVLGAGAIGSLWAAGWHCDERPVVLIGRRPRDGFTLHAAGAERVIAVPTVTAGAMK
ncbi:MAG: 2-dehydropantoate 2-reductase N-terminal domain-containing protein [Pseudomonadota bacterium]